MRFRVSLMFLLCVLLNAEFTLSSCSCGSYSFFPNHTIWASQFKGIIYTAELCWVDEVKWAVNYTADKYWGSRSFDQATYSQYNGTWKAFDYTEFNSSLVTNGSCMVTVLEVTIPMNQSFDGINLQLTSLCHGWTCRNCNQTLPDDVVVTSSTGYDFNSSGNFSCPNNEKLFYSDGIELNDTETVCLQSAQWLAQDGLQCWSEPNVTLQHNLTSCNVVNATVSFSCLYDDTLPQGNMSSFVIDSKVHNVMKGKPYLLHLQQQQHNGSKIFCQAQTPFTGIYPETGKSDIITINVFSQPGTVETTVGTSVDVIKSGATIFLNSYQNVSLYCKSDVDSATCEWKFNETKFSNSCDVSQHFNQSGYVTCNVSNCSGSKESESYKIIVVEPRTAKIIQSNPSIIEGETLVLLCEIDYQNELNTTFHWITPPNVFASSVSTLHVQNVTRFEGGNYSCTTSDLFQTSYVDIQINVQYQPYDVALLIPQDSGNITHTGSRLLLNGNQNVTMLCASDANPQANCIFQFLNQIPEFSESCKATQHIYLKQSVTCIARNVYGNEKSPPLEVIVVTENDRIPIIRFDLNDTGQIKTGDELSLKCSVLYQNELNSSFVWKIPSKDRDTDVSTSVLKLNNITRFDWGNYTCINANNFGTTQSTVFVNVLFPPVGYNNTVACNHHEVAAGTCNFQFSSNPLADSWSLTANGKEVYCPYCSITLHHENNLQQTFHLDGTYVLAEEYQLILTSSSFPHAPLTAYIYVTITYGPTLQRPTDPKIIASSVFGGIVLVAIVIAVVFFYRRKYIQKRSGKSTKQDDLYMNTSADGKQKDATNNTELEMPENYYEELDDTIYENDVDKANSNYEIVSSHNKEERTYATDI